MLVSLSCTAPNHEISIVNLGQRRLIFVSLDAVCSSDDDNSQCKTDCKALGFDYGSCFRKTYLCGCAITTS